MKTLYEVAKDFGTDKASHGYCPHYEKFLSNYKSMTSVLLEMGVANGESLRMWHEWLPLARIVGMDISDRPENLDPIIKTFKGDQGKTEDLERLTKETPNFDIIIDDAGHDTKQQAIAFDFLWPRLVVGGWYAIEDISLNFGSQDKKAVLLNQPMAQLIGDKTDYSEFHYIVYASEALLLVRKR